MFILEVYDITAWVGICQWVIDTIRIPIQGLRIAEALYHGICADKPPNGSIIVSCSVIVKPG
jgi:hypothetical protein